MSKMQIKTIIELIIIFIITLLINLLVEPMSLDEIWNYGFSYNIANGLIPYKDFNLVIFPFYPILNSLILLIFGKNLLVFHIFNAILCTIIFCLLKKISPHSYYLIYFPFLIFSTPNYSLLCLLLLLIIIYNEEQKSPNNYLIGLLIGLIITTKQNIGLFLLIPCLYIKLTSKKELFKRIIGIITPIFLMLLYLIITNSLNEWFNYTILGLQDFRANNSSFNFLGIILLPIIIILLYHLIIKKDHSQTILYSLFFLSTAYPICDPYHITIAIIPSLVYLLNKLKLSIKIEQASFIIITITIIIFSIKPIMNNKTLYPNQTQTYKYRLISKDEEQLIKNVANYLKSIDKEVSIYILELNAYGYKLESNIPINKYDLINNGNMGKNGAQSYIKEINTNCNQNKCLFLIDKLDLSSNTKPSQINTDIINYVVDTYQYQEKIAYLNVYGNYKERK